jgi:hypothetical protein
MDYSIKISKIKKSKIDNLIISINIVKPKSVSDTNQLYNRWMNASKNERENFILSFFSSRTFTELELKKIYQLTTKLVIPWKKVFYLLITILIIFISSKAYLYNKLDRVYYIGSSKTINPISNSTFIVNPKLEKENIFYSTITSSKKSFLKINDVENNLLIQEDNFIKWIFGNTDSLKVDSVDFVQSKIQYYKYIEIFQPIINHKDFKILSSLDRKAVFNFIKKNNNIQSVSYDLANEIDSIQLPGFSIITKNFDYNTKEYLIFIRFKLLNNENKNYTIKYKNFDQPNYTRLIPTGKTNPLDNLIYYKPIPNTLEIDVYEIKGKRNYKIYSNSPDELIPQE